MLTIPFSLPDPTLDARLARIRDVEAKVPRALQELGPIVDRRVAVLGEGAGPLAAQLEALGGRIVARLQSGDTEGLAPAGVDVVVTLDEAFGTPSAAAERRLAAVERVLCRPGRLLVTLPYGRDDVTRLIEPLQSDGGAPEAGAKGHGYAALRQRDRWFLERGFKLRVIHGWWTFAGLDDAADFLGAAFGAPGESVAAGMKRPRLSYKVVVYHRSLAVPGDGEQGAS